MPALSRRVTALADLGGRAWEIYYRARALEAAGETVLDLTVGEPDTRMAPPLLDAMDAAARAGQTGYAPVPGLPALRAALARRHAAASGQPAEAANILVTPGAQAALYAAHHAILDEGDRALIVDPYYATYPGTIRALGAVPVPVTARAEAGFLPDPGALDRAAAGTGARSLLLNAPNNPTGAVYDRATLDGIAEVVRARDLWLVSDEVYDTQAWDAPHLPAAALPGLADRVLTVGSLSKSHAMTGARLGWVAGPVAAIAAMIDLATHTTYGVPGFVQAAGLAALGRGAAAERANAAPFRRRRDAALARLADAPGLAARRPGGAMYLMLDVRATGLDGIGFARALLEDTRVAVMPGESFGAAAAGHVRLALTLPDADLAVALDRIAGFAAARVAAGGRGA